MAIWAKIKSGALAALVFVVAFFGVWRVGKNSGRKEAQAERLSDDLHNMANTHEVIKEVQNEVDKKSDADIDRQLESKWVRKKD